MICPRPTISRRLPWVTMTLAFLAACPDAEAPADGGPEPEDAGSGTGGPVTVHFEHRVDGTALELSNDTTPYTSEAGNQFNVTRLMYFVTDVTLTMSDGSTVKASGPHYVDHEDAASRDFQIAAEVVPGDLESISFVMGIPAAQNTSGSLPNPPESLMFWPDSMGGGYHYMKLEGRYLNTAGELANLRAHAGPTEGVDYSFSVTLDATGRTVPEAGATFTVVMNIDQWFKEPHTWDFNQYFEIAGIMDDPVKQAELKENGADVWTLED